MTLSAALIIIVTTLFLAYANGANDNFKGVATLFGSGTTSYRGALAWATGATLAGSAAAFFLALKLVKTFSGKGLVPDTIIANPVFLMSVALGAGLTVFFAARAGIPISTTHSLTGALVGGGFMAVGTKLGWNVLGKSFFLPLLASPVIAIALTWILYTLLTRMRKQLGLTKETCFCAGEKSSSPAGFAAVTARTDSGNVAMLPRRKMHVFVDKEQACAVQAVTVYSGKLFGFTAQNLLDKMHFLSAGAVCFARGLNDTPKIVALCFAANVLNIQTNLLLIGILMAAGGIFSAQRIAETVSHRITGMNHGQGFTANLITALLVIFASRWGVPVSTTHVSCGSLFGIGLSNGQADWKVISGIVSAWVLTLPVAAGCAAVSFAGLSRVFIS